MFTRFNHKPGNVFAATSLLVGTAIGAGIFALPYVISKSGFVVGVLYIVSLGLVSLVVNLAYGEVVLSTKGTHQFPAYVEKYLGKRWKNLALIILFVGFYGALAAYLLEVSNLLFTLFNPLLGGNRMYYLALLFVGLASALYFGLRAIAKLEKIMVVALLLLTLVLILGGISHVRVENLLTFDAHYLLLPYGVILFAFSSASAVPDMKNILAKEPHLLKKAIVMGSVIPLVVYLLFTLVAVGITGQHTTPSVVIGLGQQLGAVVLLFGALFGILSMSNSFLSLGLVLKEVFQYDLRLPHLASWIMVLIPPAFMVLLGWLSFIEILGISGALIGGINGIIFILLHQHIIKKRERTPEYTLPQSKFWHLALYIVFVGGIIYEAYMIITSLMA